MSSSLRIKDISKTISSLCPIKIYVDGNCVFDDDKVTQPLAVDKEWAKYQNFLEK